jgi:hypothetical protein
MTAAPISSVGEAEQVIANLNKIMDSLAATLEQETAHLRAGKVRDAVDLEQAKAEFSRLYTAESMRLKAAGPLVARELPEALAALRDRHTAFRTLLQTNLTVLATAHAVSEGIVRGVSGELVRKRVPSTYSAKGQTNKPSPKVSLPLAISRTL